MITDQDIAQQVSQALAPELSDFDLDAIVSEIQATYGLVDIDTIPHDDFWALVERHDIS